MSDLRKAAQQALDEWQIYPGSSEMQSAMKALRAALAQPEKFCDDNRTWRDHHPDTNLPAMYSSSLQCFWVAWTVVDAGILRLDMPGINVCDMRGAIKAAESLCSAVWRIDTYSGGKPDTMYVLRRGGWECVNRRSADVLFRTYPAMATLADSEGGEV